jgi:hypothetical protein
MAVIKEFVCIEHGEFESTHAICPGSGCDSRHVKQEFRTPVTIRSSTMKRFDAGIRRSSDMMGGKNFRTAKAGEASFGGDVGKQNGMQVLWGDESRKVLGQSFAQLSANAHKPLVVPKRDGSGNLVLEKNNAMREAATEMGITRRRLPLAAEVMTDKESQGKAQAVVS